MKHNIKKFLLPLLAAASVTFGACSDWTESESLDINYPSLEEQNPELYKRYLAALRDYKKSEHKVVIYIMPGGSAAPVQRNEHITNAPDSVDFICLTNPVDLHPTLVAEIQKVHEKGTRVIYKIDYNAIEKRWKALLEEEANQPGATAEGEDGGDDSKPTEEERFLAFCKEQVALWLSYCDSYKFDGIEVAYTGRALDALNESELAILTARQDAFLAGVREWHIARPGMLLFFQGSPQNLIDRAFLAKCAYITLDTFGAASVENLTLTALMAAVDGVPADRFVVGVKTPSLVDPTLPDGYFAGLDTDGKSKLRATKGAALWVVAPEAKYTKAGIAIADAQNDYFNTALIYKNIREAIGIMNPTPKN